MKPGTGAAIVGAVGVAQMGAAAAVAALIGRYLDGSFPLDDTGDHMVSCALSMKSASACTAGYVSSVVSLLLSLALIAMQCATSEGRAGMGFCGPILSAVGFFWWVAYAGSATSAAIGAGSWDDGLDAYRDAVLGVSWAAAVLFLASFCVSAAAAAAAARARNTKAVARAAALHSSSSKRYNQPAASPPASPCKSHKSYGSAYDPFETDSPKKWVQPMNPRAAASHIAVTSDGLRTLLLVEGEADPVPLTPNLSPMGSPMHRSPMHRSPMHRSPLASPVHRSLAHIATRGGGTAADRAQLQRLTSGSAADRAQLQRLTSGSGGTAVGTFSNVLLPQGSQQL